MSNVMAVIGAVLMIAIYEIVAVRDVAAGVSKVLAMVDNE